MKKNNILLLCIVTIIIVFSINVYADGESCGTVFTPEFISSMKTYVYTPIKWATPVILLLLTSFDFAKVVFSGDGKGMDKAKNNFFKRAIAALIIFFAPDIISLLVEFINNQSIASCSNQFK